MANQWSRSNLARWIYWSIQKPIWCTYWCHTIARASNFTTATTSTAWYQINNVIDKIHRQTIQIEREPIEMEKYGARAVSAIQIHLILISLRHCIWKTVNFGNVFVCVPTHRVSDKRVSCFDRACRFFSATHLTINCIHYLQIQIGWLYALQVATDTHTHMCPYNEAISWLRN